MQSTSQCLPSFLENHTKNTASKDTKIILIIFLTLKNSRTLMKNFYQSYHSSRFTILLDNTYTIHCPSQKICSMLVSAIIIEIDAAIVKDKEQQDLHVSKPSWERDATTHVANSPTSSPICQTDVNYGCQNFTTLRYTDPESYPMTMLASYPGSGNTWMRVLLSSLTGKNPTDRSFLGL